MKKPSPAYQDSMGTEQARDTTLDLEFIGIQSTDLHELDEIFTEEEVWRIIKELHPDRATRPNGFTGAFYQRAWPIIKQDIMAAIMKLYICEGRALPN